MGNYFFLKLFPLMKIIVSMQITMIIKTVSCTGSIDLTWVSGAGDVGLGLGVGVCVGVAVGVGVCVGVAVGVGVCVGVAVGVGVCVGDTVGVVICVGGGVIFGSGIGIDE